MVAMRLPGLEGEPTAALNPSRFFFPRTLVPFCGRLCTPAAGVLAEADEKTDVGHAERHEVGDGDLDPGRGSGMPSDHHVELVDSEQYGAHDQRGEPGPRQVGPIEDAAK